MATQQTTTFQSALETIESLPDYQQECLIDIIHHRLAEHRRDMLAKNIEQIKKEHREGKTVKGTVNDLMHEIDG